jgi:KAP family P-loop domain
MELNNINSEFIDAIRKVSELPEMQEVRNSKEFWLEKLRQQWNGFEALSHYNVRAEENIKAPIGKSSPIDWESLLKEFKSKRLSYSKFYDLLETKDDRSAIKFCFTLMGKLVANFDTNAYKSKEWNKYNPPRHLAFSGVMTTTWVKNLLKYKIVNNFVNNSWNVLSPNIKNAVLYIKEPAGMIAMVSPKHAARFSELILKTSYNPNDHFTFCRQVIDLFRFAEINCLNPENNGVLIGKILYHGSIKSFWLNPELESETMKDEDGIVEENETKEYSQEQDQNQTNFPTSYSRSIFAPTDDIPTTLGADRLADELVNLLEAMGNGKGQMIGLFGQWGRGKSHLAGLAKKSIHEKKKKFIWVDFHAWKYQDTHAVWAYLYESLSAEYFKSGATENWLTKQFRKYQKRFKINKAKNGVWPLVFFVLLLLAATFSFFKLDLHALRSKWTISAGLTSFLTLVSAYFNFVKKRTAEKASDLIKRYFSHKSFSDLLGVQAEIQKEMKILLKTWIPKPEENRILLFVDDIDRCPEEQIIRMIDALRVMLEDEDIAKRVLILTAVDERMLKRAIITKYHDMIKKDPALNEQNESIEFLKITQEYMDKLFISGIKLGVLTIEERESLLESILKINRKNTPHAKDEKTVMNPSGKAGDAIYNAIKVVGLRDSGLSTNAAKALTQTANSDLNTVPESVVINNPEDKQEVKLVEPIPTSSSLISEQEEKALQVSIPLLSDATPRKIRIHYYRYLLARNLLAEEMSLPDSITPEILSDYLAIYSAPQHLSTISLQKRLTTGAELEEPVNVPLPGKEYKESEAKLKPEQAHKLFEVLETVIAY